MGEKSGFGKIIGLAIPAKPSNFGLYMLLMSSMGRR
jgi:hypothetical protein